VSWNKLIPQRHATLSRLSALVLQTQEDQAAVQELSVVHPQDLAPSNLPDVCIAVDMQITLRCSVKAICKGKGPEGDLGDDSPVFAPECPCGKGWQVLLGVVQVFEQVGVGKPTGL
jgi:hypothetical protein